MDSADDLHAAVVSMRSCMAASEHAVDMTF